MSTKDFSKQNILVLGAGELGMSVLSALSELRGKSRVPPVSVLLRPVTDRPDADVKRRAETLDSLGIATVEADLAAASIDDLASLFSRYSTVVCCTGFVGGRGTQRKITSAVLQAGVKQYIPWQFGVDYDAVGRGSGQEVWDEQLDVRQMLRGQSEVDWKIISTGMFMSFVFVPEFGVADLSAGRVRALGSWDYRLTLTTAEDIGLLTALVLESWNEIADEIVFVAGDTVSYRELADIVEDALDRPVERLLWSVPELEKDAGAEPNNPMPSYRLAFARPEGVAWPKEHTFNARRNIAVTDISGWLRERAGGGAYRVASP
ncbi:MAG: aromatic alcohol reductase [Methyloligella sp. ZOD6]